MSKRQEIRARRRREHTRNRILVILLVVAGALLIAFLLIRSSSNPPAAVKITPVAPRTLTVPTEKTGMGAPNAPVKMDAWEDFQCSGCKYYTDNIEPQIVKNYVETGKVYLTYHFFTLIDQGNPGGESHQAANAAMCAAEQGRFWDYHDILFANWLGENVGGFTDVRLAAFASTLKLNMGDFNTCFQANRYKAQIDQDVAAGQAKGVQSTPSVFVDGQLVIDQTQPNVIPSYNFFAAVIEAKLAGH